jgi:hypothetical protein
VSTGGAECISGDEDEEEIMFKKRKGISKESQYASVGIGVDCRMHSGWRDD